MNCQFCPKQIASLTGGSYRECPHCNTAYIVDVNETVVARNHWINLNNTIYVIRVELQYHQLMIGSPNLMTRHIILTADYPHDTITPQNIKDKLKTYLTFL